MKTEHAKNILAEMIKTASEFDRTGNVVMRNQMIKNITDLPLRAAYIRSAIRSAGLM